MQRLYVLYDDRCELCRRLKQWLGRQPAWLELKLLSAGSSHVKQMFPGLEEIASNDDLVVISDQGEVFLNNHAWIMCLYALREYRGWAYRLSHPLLLPLARQAFDVVSRNRHAISHWLGESDTETIAQALRQVTLEPCLPPEGTLADYLR